MVVIPPKFPAVGFSVCIPKTVTDRPLSRYTKINSILKILFLILQPDVTQVLALEILCILKITRCTEIQVIIPLRFLLITNLYTLFVSYMSTLYTLCVLYILFSPLYSD